MSRADDAAAQPTGELRELAAAYALGALDEADRRRFERALADSPELRSEVEAFRSAASSLGEAVPPITPPQSLKADLFARLDEHPQEQPRDGGSADDPVVEVVPADRVERPEPMASASPAPVDELAARRRRRRLAVVLSSAAALLLLVAGVVVGVNWPGPNGWGAQRELAALADAPDAERATVEAAAGGQVTLVWSAEQRRSAIVAEGLPDVGDDRTYELWYIDDEGAVSAGTFDVHDEEAWRLLEGEFAPGVVVGLTVEPAGGSERPTTDPVAVIPT
ncbi:anti-sigma factor domain-containing protein [Agromyces sp. NPDC056523]|uniref:anti-sigma factor n=1 Tax=Agromyces sp. NPDC056523 TaxID=3345850 RepID=UPI00366EBFD7